MNAKPDSADNAIDTVIFDIGNVLIGWNPRWLYRKLLPDDSAVERFLHEVNFEAWNAAHDAGQQFAVGIAEHGDKFPHYRHLFQSFFDRWEETVGEPIQESVDLAHRLRMKGYRTLALTNFSSETFPRALRRFPFLGEFEGVVVSGRESIMKPDPAIYHLLCSRYGVQAEKAVFIDDSFKNVEGARSVGMRAVHFTNPPQMLAELAALGVSA